ncbi:MAG: GYD domain-containing protein [Anaerolineae bacterium]|nr:GYD domain-containing protein [Anaerolineae bacterium]
MFTFIMLSTLTDEGAKTITTNPQRIKEVNQEIEHLGVRVLRQYATMGQFDFISIVEAPDNETIVRVSAELSSRGSIRLQTVPAIPIDAFIAKFK